ncbi:sulfite exporter TauE/SafE family protein [Weissella diestrammenae]|uniref:Sulfite exporter TauE/SafE family protein n=1 Tax=Weissella diestrammenae TaxID=1162633 RepID=A0A7G9T3Z2_9LACO|nr:sulfite exporter TauE/SafE family protein [Weissella diestrammenae]MCM0583013.1 sulfite exporter TauE/SafE family protein [Weissella diestrammenae]QNN74817.1 sulfite exporter TauE/SafE family protein [Weissella diestrammenae]
MNEQLILHGLQLILIIAIFLLGVLFAHQMYVNRINIKEKFVSGFLIGLITDFGDTIGIGSFATTTTAFKLTGHMADDRQLPGTMNAAHAIPVIVEASFFLTAVKVSLTTLIPMTLAAMLGAGIGTKITMNWNARMIQRGLSITLTVAAIVMLVNTLTSPNIPVTSHGLVGWQLVVGVIFNLGIGILMTIGLGNYTPELIFFALMGVNPLVAFPVMMMDAAMIMFAATINFVKTKRVQWQGLFGIVIGGVVGVVIAATLVKHIDTTLLRYAIVGLALWTAYSLFRESIRH